MSVPRHFVILGTHVPNLAQQMWRIVRKTNPCCRRGGGAHFHTYKWSWREPTFVHESKRGPKPRINVLARLSVSRQSARTGAVEQGIGRESIVRSRYKQRMHEDIANCEYLKCAVRICRSCTTVNVL
jgi:hypothetical protein